MMVTNVLTRCCIVLGIGWAAVSMAGERSLLYNPGPRYRAGLTFVDAPGTFCTLWGSTRFWDAHLDENPPGWCPNPYQCAEGLTDVAADRSCESYYHDTRVGWTIAELNRYPGWSIWELAGGAGHPLVFQYLNRAYWMPDPCTLREVGFMVHRWNDSGTHNFRVPQVGRSYRLGDFQQVQGRFTARRADQFGPPRCTSFPTGFITADFRVWYIDSAHRTVRMDLLGVVVYNMNGWDTDGNPDNPYFWADACTNGQCRTLLHGIKLGLPVLTQQFQSYVIDYKALLAQYSPPPSGFTVNDAVIVGFDVYTSVRGADLDFILTGVDVVGVVP